MGEYIAPFDVKKIYLDYLLGSPALVSFALLILISYTCAYFQFSNRNFALVLIISSVIFALYLGEALFFLVLLIVGFVLFKIFARFFA